ncbi:MAG: branched-chain amino acid aminotransferase [Crocinitomicaceae bacterium]|nr:branched-chain amino acid aminotransferase [Crocinitomicaceae bacterium]
MISNTVSIDIQKVGNSRVNEIDFENLPFGREFSDHMFVMDYADGKWGTPKIIPFGNIQIHPATSALHYGQSIFEGMKAYRNKENEAFLFRPDMNIKRMNISCQRMCMPEIPEEIFMEALKTLVSIDKQWIPDTEGGSLYIRPFMFATDEYVGIKPSDNYRFMIFTCPVGGYYSTPVKVKLERHYTRAARGGVGQAKTAGNYAASLYPAKLAQQQGYHQLLWTDGLSHEYIEESGTMNVCFMINGKLITPSEDSDTILKGITKRSVIEIAKSWGVEVEERPVKVAEVIDAIENGSLTEMFGAGTAATIAHIEILGVEGRDYVLPAIEGREFSNKVNDYLTNLKKGKIEDPFNWNIKL